MTRTLGSDDSPWLGGPGDDSQANGHPRLGMRHGRVPVASFLRNQPDV